MAVDATLPALPADAVLVHIGMHKTGTTAMQTLLGAHRTELGAHGVVYPGPRDDHHGPARALTQRPSGPGGIAKPPPPQLWSDLAARVSAEPGRVVLSSEFFSGARDDQPAKLARDVGPQRVHVIVGIRSPASTAVSTWQQTLKEGRVLDLDRWAAYSLPRAGKPPKNGAYWEHWDLGAMVRRWADGVGVDRVTVVVLDGQDRRRLPATFEQLLGLPAGLLSGARAPVSNRGMTAAEVELVRRLNVAVRGKLEWPDYRRVIRYGTIRSMVESRTPGPDEPRPALPPWAVTELNAAGERFAEQITASGVRVVGDLAALAAAVADPAPPGPVDATPVDAAVAAIVGTAMADLKLARPPAGRRPVDQVPARELVRTLAERARRRAARAARQLRRRPT